MAFNLCKILNDIIILGKDQHSWKGLVFDIKPTGRQIDLYSAYDMTVSGNLREYSLYIKMSYFDENLCNIRMEYFDRCINNLSMI